MQVIGATYVPSQQVPRVRLSCLECCGLMTQLGRKEDQLFGTCGPFKERVVLLFETNPFKGAVVLGDLQEWKVLWKACWGRERRCLAPVIRTDLSSAA